MIDLRDISISIISSAHGKYSSTWGGGDEFCDPFARLYYVAGGHGLIKHQMGEVELKAGGLYLMPTQTMARYSCSPYIDLYWLHFTATLHGLISVFSLLDPAYEKHVDDIPYAPELFNILVAKPVPEDPGKSLEADGAVRQLLGCFYSDLSASSYPERLSSLSRIRPVLDYIDDNIAENITLGSLAEVVHLYPHYFSNLFKEIMRVPPMTYLLRRRIEKAQQLLVLSQEPVKRIGWIVGFADEFYFSRAFKKVVGMAPMDYRRNIEQHRSA